MSFYSKIAQYYDKLFPFNKMAYSFIAGHIQNKNSDILDIGCGTGRMAGEIAGDGNRVTAIDIDTEMLHEGQVNYPEVDFITLDMSDIGKLIPGYNLIYSIGNVMSYLPVNILEFFLKDIYQLLRPGAVWLFQTVNWDRIQKSKTSDFPVLEVVEKNVKFTRKYNNISQSQVEFVTRCTKDGKEIVKDSAFLYPCLEDSYLQLHKHTGFKFAGHYGDYKKSKYMKDTSPASIFEFRK
jgi:2-polyprenyl-3-methyl-5-hydroxy-6-metoxy-1,4-benzoquinol methylase